MPASLLAQAWMTIWRQGTATHRQEPYPGVLPGNTGVVHCTASAGVTSHMMRCAAKGALMPPKAPSCLQFKCHSLHGCIAELRVWSRALDSKEASLRFTRHSSAVLLPSDLWSLLTCSAGCAACH